MPGVLILLNTHGVGTWACTKHLRLGDGKRFVKGCFMLNKCIRLCFYFEYFKASCTLGQTWKEIIQTSRQLAINCTSYYLHSWKLAVGSLRSTPSSWKPSSIKPALTAAPQRTGDPASEDSSGPKRWPSCKQAKGQTHFFSTAPRHTQQGSDKFNAANLSWASPKRLRRTTLADLDNEENIMVHSEEKMKIWL